MWLTKLAAGLLLSTSVASGKPCGGHDDLAVRLPGGTVVHGMVDDATPAVRQFLSIPFAQPPVGDLRFAPPMPLQKNTSGHVDATKMPPSCMQYLSSGASVYTREVLEFNLEGLNKTGTISEDCLYLSVWSPRSSSAINQSKEPLPVLVYVYGGGFSTGGIDVPYQLPAQWIQRSQSHIVVSFNYRLNIFGYPNAAGLDASANSNSDGGNQNPGLLDQRLAVEWVRDNIAAFGGDPSRIGLWGQSAGAVSVGYYGYTYASDPIVSSLIMDSGSELLGIGTPDPSHTNFTFVASQLGCDNLSSDPAAELACVRSLDADEIEDFVHSYSDAGTSPALSFAPVVDGMTVFENYTALALDGKVARVPTILGTNANDGLVFTPYDPDGVNATLAYVLGLQSFYCPALQAAKNRLAGGGEEAPPVYRYMYSGNFTNVSPKGWMGAYHSSELPMLFGTHPLYRGDSGELEYGTSHAMQDHWLAFVAGGKGLGGSVGEGPAWVSYQDDGEDAAGMEFGDGVPAKMVDLSGMDGDCGQFSD